MQGRNWLNTNGGADGKAKSAKKRYVLYASLLVLAVAGGVTRWVMTLESGRTWPEAPPETWGFWTTDDERYAGRAIEVSAESVVLHLGTDGTIPGSVQIARERFDDDVRILRVEYVNTNGSDAVEIVLEAAGTMHLFNQPDITWSAIERVGVPTPPPPDETVAEASNPTGLLTVVGLAALVLLAGLWVAIRTGAVAVSDEEAPGGAPKIVRGVWTTPDPRFAGQSIRITYGYGFAQFGPGDVRIGGAIDSVREWKENGDRVVSLKYRTKAGLEDLELVIDRSGHMRLRGGPSSIWVKQPAAVVAGAGTP